MTAGALQIYIAIVTGIVTLSGVHSRRIKLNGTDLHRVDPVTRRVIGHARQRHEADWLQGCTAHTAVCELQLGSVQFSSCAVNTALVFSKSLVMSNCVKGKGSPYSITDRKVPELIPVLGSQPAGGVT